MQRIRIELPIGEVVVPTKEDPTGSVVFFLNENPEVKAKHDPTGLYFSMTWQNWLSLGKVTTLRMEIESEASDAVG